jgi:hypothetical protein
VQVLIHVISFAFLIVMASTAIFTPVLLYVFGLKELGWEWQHGALFSAMIASTDAVAVSAILKKGAVLQCFDGSATCVPTQSMGVHDKGLSGHSCTLGSIFMPATPCNVLLRF